MNSGCNLVDLDVAKSDICFLRPRFDRASEVLLLRKYCKRMCDTIKITRAPQSNAPLLPFPHTSRGVAMPKDRDRLKCFSVLLSITQAAPGRNTRNLGKGM